MQIATLTTRDDFFAVRPLLPGLAPTPRIILGTAGLGSVWGEVNEDESIATLHDAWADGFLFCDTAPSYARAELVVGAALKKWSGAAPVIATKFGYESAASRDYSAAGLAEQFTRSIERFGGTRPSLVAVHDAPIDLPEATRTDAVTYLRKLVADGDVQHVGLGGGGPASQRAWLESGAVGYILTYNRLNACLVDALRDSVPQAHLHNAKAFAASPLFMGMLGRKFEAHVGNPPGHVGAELVTRAKAAKRIADEAGVSLAHVSLRFLMSMNEIDAVVVGASSLAEWRETRAAFEAGPLPADLFNAVLAIATPPAPPGHSGG